MADRPSRTMMFARRPATTARVTRAAAKAQHRGVLQEDLACVAHEPDVGFVVDDRRYQAARKDVAAKRLTVDAERMAFSVLQQDRLPHASMLPTVIGDRSR
jgi:hypothetical protein